MNNFIREARQAILTMSYHARVGHVPSALSMVDYLSILFRYFVDPRRDKVILGKPYGAQAYYAVFAQCGWIQPQWSSYGSEDPSWRYCMGREHPLVTFIDDTLGNALSVACGIAMGFPGRVYVNASDAYFQAGSVWESIMFAGAHRLNNMVMTVDNNHMQVLGFTPDILDVEPLKERLSLFGWRALSADGHDLTDIHSTCEIAFASPSPFPTAIVFNTVKGHGVSFMENQSEWHYRELSLPEFNAAMEEVS